MKLLISALTKYLAGMVMMGALIFIPAGTLGWWQGWLMMGILFAPMMVMGAVMLIYAPELLEKRIKNKEERSTQKGVVALSGLTSIASFVVMLPYIPTIISRINDEETLLKAELKGYTEYC